MFCTSNLPQGIVSSTTLTHPQSLTITQDPAFLDRVDDKYHVMSPSPRARWEIFRQEYYALLQSGVLSARDTAEIKQDHDSSEAILDENQPASRRIFREAIAPYEKTKVLPTPNLDPVSQKFRRLVDETSDMSGRALRNLPEKALGMVLESDSCGLLEALDEAIRKAPLVADMEKSFLPKAGNANKASMKVENKQKIGG